MKKRKLFTGIIFFLLIFSFAFVAPQKDQKENADEIQIAVSSDLLELAKQWIRDFEAVHPGASIQIAAVEADQLNNKSMEEFDLAILSGRFYSNLNDKNCWCMPLAKEVIVPVYNTENPFAATIEERGMSPAQLSTVISRSGNKGWEIIDEDKSPLPVHYYYVEGKIAQEQLHGFLGEENFEIMGSAVKGMVELREAVQQDAAALAFCNLNDILDPEKNCFPEKIKLLPIDRNANGKIDYFENIYNDPNHFSRGIWVGKFPPQLVSHVYAIAANKPGTEAEQELLKWILTEGQKLLAKQGYTELFSSERNAKISSLVETDVVTELEKEDYSGARIFLYVVIALVIAGILFGLIYRAVGRKKEVEPEVPRTIGILNENRIEVPAGLYFDKTHTWAFLEKDGKVKVGIDDFLQRVTGIFTNVKLKRPGERINKNEKIVSLLQDGKQIEIYAPVSGVIREVNLEIEKKPSLVNTSPFQKGWIFKIEPSNWPREIQFLQMADQYKN